MIDFLTGEQLGQLEYLFSQSACGNHLLFDREKIKQVFLEQEKSKPQERVINLKKLDLIRKMIEKLIMLPTLSQKRAFIDNLPDNAKTMLIKAYFNMLDHTLKSHHKTTLH